ncbi:hypothetical protein DE146DRAFT_747918 [Phaeosphaeria sp. MPI-PUGE-AT-0046c]|nr:hypothetical protein DE146DRAFT_747918 [Phaeosphaeria sp. MPI-PUGE-AT-0046c]
MSKKGNDTPTSVRIRDNQRRSRNRRKELIDDLQARVKDYERKGVTATQHMQHAARYVALENTRLRTLLARHGVQQAEVDAYLRSCDGSDASQRVPTSTDAVNMPPPGQRPPSAPISRCGASAAPATNGLQPPTASIIIEMRGEGDVDSVRASLGCVGRESCTVRNSTVLQIMDER